jgi:glucuronoarabinoxylan endo-1,4-beta-xylanase
MQMAQARGAKIWSAPWSPEAKFKSNTNVNGGSFVGTDANYQAYASQLAGYVAKMKSQYGVSLYAISIQNEPDANVTSYESCNWTPQQIHDFVPYLAAALSENNLASTKIMLPESQNWRDYQGLATITMNDPAVATNVDIIACHNYDGENGPANLVKNSYGKALWETEVSILSGSDGSIGNGVYYAGRIYQFMTKAEVNAWHYWWLIAGNSTGNEGLMDNNAAPTKRLFAVGQYSRFVRPGYYRIGVADGDAALVSAYKDPDSGSFAIVAVNTNVATIINQTFHLDGFDSGTVTPWITSATLSLESQSNVAVSNSSFVFPLPPMSVVTFVGQTTSNAPVLTDIPDQVIDAGETLTITNVVTGLDEPVGPLVFSLLFAPTNSAVDAASGIFSWRPLVEQADSTNLITIKVSETAIPNLSATNSFHVIVNPLAPTVVKDARTSDGKMILTVSGPTGPDYTLLSSTNLLDWNPIFTTNSPTAPMVLMDTNSGDGARFYRIQLGP